jgi:hypothetical protein
MKSASLCCYRWNSHPTWPLFADFEILEKAMARRSLVRRTQHKIAGAAKESAAYIQNVATRAAAAAAIAAAEAAVTSMMRSMTKTERGATARQRRVRASEATQRRAPRRKTSRRSSRNRARKTRL